MKYSNTILGMLALALPLSSHAQTTAYIDLGDADNSLNSGTHGGVYWSTIGGATTVSLKDSVSGDGLPWSIQAANVEGDSPNSVGPMVPASHVFTTSDAATDGLWNRPGGNDQRLIFTISGLDPSGVTTYDLSLFGNRSNNNDAGAIFHVQGAGALISSATIPQGNTTGTNTPLDVNGVQADFAGKIVIELQTPDGTDLSILSAMSITSSNTAQEYEPYDLAVAPGEWTIALIPDTQYYTQDHPAIFDAQTDWLRDNQRDYNIRFALHVGDITNDNVADQWKRARNAMENLDGRLPYFFVPGNHDYGPNGNASTRDTLMNDYFKYDDYSTRPHFGAAKDIGKMDNTYHTISAGGYDWIIMCLEWGPTQSTIDWANTVLTAHPNHKAILVTHAYMYYDDSRYDHTGPNQSWNPHGDYSTPGNPNDGQELWDKLVKNHHFVLTVNGHVLGDGTGFRTDPDLAGNQVHQMLANYQSGVSNVANSPNLSGNGYFRLLTIKTDGTVQVKTYSPIYNHWDTDADQQFTFSIADWYAPTDTNSNSVADYYDSSLDSDLDGLNNYEEFMIYGTDPKVTDSDSDGIADGLEVQIGTNPAISEQITKEAILNNANEFGYYNEQGIIDVNTGKLMISPNGNFFDLKLQLETTEDLGNIPFAPSGAPIQWSVEIPSDKYFMRVRSEP